MPTFEFTSPEGKTYTVNGPDGATKEQAFQILQQQLGAKPQAEPSLFDKAVNVTREAGSAIARGGRDLIAGGVRGAGSIGATIVAPFDMASDALDGKGFSLQSNRERRAKIDEGLRDLTGADTNSLAYGAGKLGGEIAGTAGAGSALATGLRAAPGVSTAIANSPRAAQLVESIATGGFRTGAPAAANFGQAAANLGIRAGGGAINGALTAGMVNPEDAGMGAAIGGGLPVATAAIGAAGKQVGKALAGKPVADDVRNLALRAQELGIDIPADRIANSKPLNAVASGLNYVPFSGRAATEAKMQNQLNTALSKTFGENTDNVTMGLRSAKERLGGEFDRVLQSNTVKVDSQFLDDLSRAYQQAADELSPSQASIIHKQIDNLLEKGNAGQIDGQAAYNVKKTLDRIGKRNTPEAWYALDLKQNLMDALNRSMPQAEAEAFAGTRQQYGNMLTLQKLAQNGVDGDVSIARLANTKNIKSKDLQDLADISAQFLKAREGQHGAAQRALAGLAGGGLAGLPALTAGIAGGRVANTLLNSNIVRNGLLGQTKPLPQGLLADVYKLAPLLATNGD